MTNKANGYTMFEILLSVVALVLITTATISILDIRSSTQIQTLADEANIYAKTYLRYVLNNNSVIYNKLQTDGEQVIPWSILQKDGYIKNGNINDANALGQKPCLLIIKSKASGTQVVDQFITLLFFMGANPDNFSRTNSNSLVNQIGGLAGLYLDDANDVIVKQAGGAGIFSAHHEWQIASSDIKQSLQELKTKCDDPQLNNGSMVLNLFISYNNSASESDLYLHRQKDTSANKLGDPKNINTLTTDISLVNHESTDSNSYLLYFSGNESTTGIYLQGGIKAPDTQRPYLNLSNGIFKAETIQATTAKSIYDPCNENKLGEIVQEDSSTSPFKTQLQCTYNPLLCQQTNFTGDANNTKNYCYLSYLGYHYYQSVNTASAIPSYCPVGYILDFDHDGFIPVAPKQYPETNPTTTIYTGVICNNCRVSNILCTTVMPTIEMNY